MKTTLGQELSLAQGVAIFTFQFHFFNLKRLNSLYIYQDLVYLQQRS